MECETLTFENKGYELIVRQQDLGDQLGLVYFYIPTPGLEKFLESPDLKPEQRKQLDGCKIPVTAHELAIYPELPMPIEPGKQYVEIGAGHGSFTPYVVEALEGAEPKPIVIDPVDYSHMKEMLEDFLKYASINDYQREALQGTLNNNKIITDPRKVRLINMTLGESLTSFPELQGIADVVVDCAGPSVYFETEVFSQNLQVPLDEAQEAVIALEKKLLKPGGKHIFNEAILQY